MAKLDQWLETMFLYCSSETYDLDAFKTFLAEGDGESAIIRKQFDEVMITRSFSASDWSKEMNFAHKNDDDLYEFLATLYKFLFEEGPYPDWD